MVLPHPVDVDGFGAVVRVEQDERLLVDPELVYQIENPADQGVEFMDESRPGGPPSSPR